MSDIETLQMALNGYAAELQKIDVAMAAICSRLGVRSSGASVPGMAKAKPKRKMSAAARKRIATAQKKRWAAFHAKADAGKKAAAKKTPTKTAAPKKKLAPAVKARLVANLAKARAAKAAKKTEGEAVPF